MSEPEIDYLSKLLESDPTGERLDADLREMGYDPEQLNDDCHNLLGQAKKAKGE